VGVIRGLGQLSAHIVTTQDEQFNKHPVSLVYFVYLVHLVNLLQPNKRDKPNKPNNGLSIRLD
jgi:hypothetical protein